MPHAEPGEIKNRQGSAENKKRVAGKTQPLQQSVGAIGEEFQRTRIEVAEADRVIELQDAQREQRGEHHPGQPDVQRPETDLGRAVAPALFRNHVAQAEQGRPTASMP